MGRKKEFKKLVGETVKSVDATAINIVTITFESGKVVEIDSVFRHSGIGIINVTEVTL